MAEPVSELSSRPDITVVVMGFRNEATIVSAVESVLGQRRSAKTQVEVVVVTSGGDSSAELVRRAHPDITVIESQRRLMPGGVRNAGMIAARGQVVAFLAADCLAEPNWVEARLAAHRAGNSVVAGAITSAPPERPASWASHLTLYRGRLSGRDAGPVSFPDPAAHGSSYTVETLNRLGAFEPDIRIGEDTDAARRLGDLGTTIWFSPDVRTAHRNPRTTVEMIRDHHRRGRRVVTASLSTGQPIPPSTPLRAAVGLPIQTVGSVADVVAAVWRNGGRYDRIRLILALPWVVLAVTAGLAGRYRERFALAKTHG